MNLSIWLLFVATKTALCFTPGPAVMLVVSRALAFGARRSLWSNLGILAGNTMYFILSAFGLGALLLASHGLFFAIKWIGAAYLVWIGLATFFSRGSALSVAAAANGGASGRRLFVNGFVLQAANPKALIFFTALLPQFIDAHSAIVPQIAILAITSVCIEFSVLALYGVAAGRATRYASEPRFAKISNRISGSLLMTAGVVTATRV